MSTGRPRASSRETLAEAACELFLEQGYERTTVADITRRSGLSRSSFFNYFGSKSDVLWAGLDERIATLRERLASDEGPDAAASIRPAIEALGDGLAPDSLALALVNAEAMGLGDELEREAAVRRARIQSAVAIRLRGAGVDRIRAEVAGAAHGGAVLAAIEAWARDGAGRSSLTTVLGEALDIAAPSLGP